MPRVNYEERFYQALRRIAQYHPPRQIRRRAEKEWGLSPDNAMDAAYENILVEAKDAIRGYRARRPLAR